MDRRRVKDGEKGPLVWDVKHTMITIKDEDNLPGPRRRLIVARNALDPREVKFFLSNAPADTPVQTLLLAAFSRWRVERCCQDQKTGSGPRPMGRPAPARTPATPDPHCGELSVPGTRSRTAAGGKWGVDRPPGAHGRRIAGAELPAERTSLHRTHRTHSNRDRPLATT